MLSCLRSASSTGTWVSGGGSEGGRQGQPGGVGQADGHGAGSVTGSTLQPRGLQARAHPPPTHAPTHNPPTPSPYQRRGAGARGAAVPSRPGLVPRKGAGRSPLPAGRRVLAAAGAGAWGAWWWAGGCGRMREGRLQERVPPPRHQLYVCRAWVGRACITLPRVPPLALPTRSPPTPSFTPTPARHASPHPSPCSNAWWWSRCSLLPTWRTRWIRCPGWPRACRGGTACCSS